MVCVRVGGVSVSHPPAVVLHGRVIALGHPARSIALALVDTHFQPVPFILPRPKKQNAPRRLRC